MQPPGSRDKCSNEANESGEERQPQAVKNDGAHGLLSCFVKVTCTFLGHRQTAACCCGTEMRSEMCENVVWQTKDICWSPAVLAFEPRLKKDKREVVYKSARLYIKMYFFGESGGGSGLGDS